MESDSIDLAAQDTSKVYNYLTQIYVLCDSIHFDLEI